MLSARAADRIVVVGVLNVTPGLVLRRRPVRLDVDDAVAHACEMHAAGRRPDRRRRRVDPSRRAARRRRRGDPARAAGDPRTGRARGCRCRSTPTARPVAAAALEAGASVVNDVSGGLGDPGMAAVVRDAGCPWILMHWRGHSATMQQLAHYDDVVEATCATNCARGSTPPSRPASTRRGSSSTRAWASRRPARTTGRCSAALPTLRRRSACRCSSPRRASRSSARCSPIRTARRARSTSARTRRPRSPRTARCRACGGCACTTCGRRSTPRWRSRRSAGMTSRLIASR